MQQRLQKIISAYGIASRRQAETMITSGRITCNGRICRLGDSADPDIDEIFIDGAPLPTKGERIYIMLNKPRGYVTTLSDEKGRKDVSALVADCGTRVYPIGRLDMDSEGLLLFTNDGEFSNALMHPKREVKKVYAVKVSGYRAECLELLKQPIELDGYQIRTPEVSLIHADGDGAILKITIHEGRNRQVRRMCAAAGLSVNQLKRIAEGSLSLGKLPLGKWRYLTDAEVKALLADACLVK